MDWGSIAAGVIGLLGGHQSNPYAPWIHQVNQWGPWFLQHQREAMDQLTSPDALARDISAYTHNYDRNDASRQVSQGQQLSQGGFREPASAPIARDRAIADYTAGARTRQQQLGFELAGQGLGTLTSGAQAGAQLGAQGQAYGNDQWGWLSALPMIASAFGHHGTNDQNGADHDFWQRIASPAGVSPND